MYLSYSDYTARGGELEENLFSTLERKAEYKLDYYTQDRIKALDEVPDCVKDVLFEFIDVLASDDTSMQKLSSYSNGIESFSFRSDVDPYENLYRLAVEYLPLDLITACIY